MYKFLFILGASLIPFVAQAQDGALADIDPQFDAEPATELTTEAAVASDAEPDAITVTATGIATDIANTGQSVTIIDTAEIDAVQGADIARVLRRAPGVSVSRNGRVGGVTGFVVRGAATEQLLVLIDGVRVADPAAPSGGFDFGNLLATNVAKLDLLRGSNSTIWGSDAVGGVLDISSRGDTGLSASAEYGARDTITARASGGLSGDRYYAGLSAGFYRSDGFSAAAAGTERDGFEQFALNGSLFYDIAPDIELFATARHAVGDLEIDGFPAPAFLLADTLETQETTQYSGTAGVNYFGQDLTLKAAWSLADTERENFDRAAGTDPTFTSDGHSDRLTLRGEYRLIGGLVLAFGGEREWTSYRTAFSPREESAITGAYLQAGWVLGGLAAHLGGRIDDHDRFGSAVSLGGDVSYALGGGWRARASIGEGFKAPTLFQLYSDFGNEALRPERSTSFDAGVEYGRRGVDTHFAATLFRRDSRDLIGFVSCTGSSAALCVDRPFGTYDNFARARAQGVELEAGAALLPGLRLSAAATLIGTRDRASDRDLARRPEAFATLFADYTAPFGLELGADLRLVGDSFDDAANRVRLDAHEVFDLRAAFPVTGRVELFGRIENLFDADYQTAFGYASPGRGVFVGARARM